VHSFSSSSLGDALALDTAKVSYKDNGSVYYRKFSREDVTGKRNWQEAFLSHQHRLSSHQLISDYFDLYKFEKAYLLTHQNYSS